MCLCIHIHCLYSLLFFKQCRSWNHHLSFSLQFITDLWSSQEYSLSFKMLLCCVFYLAAYGWQTIMFYMLKSNSFAYYMDMFLIGPRLFTINSCGRCTVHLIYVAWYDTAGSQLFFCQYAQHSTAQGAGANWWALCPLSLHSQWASQRSSQWPQHPSLPLSPRFGAITEIRKVSHLLGLTLL